MSFDFGSLNEEQRKAVEATEGAVLVTAGAGSGKTRMLTHRIAYLIKEKGVKPYNILAITFTNKAANEMKERLSCMDIGADDIWVSTFHSMCVRILRRYIDRMGYGKNFSIYGEQEKENVLKKISKDLEDGGKFVGDSKELDKLRKRASFIISDVKNSALSPDAYFSLHENDEYAEFLRGMYEKYEEQLKKNNALDFDDLLVKAYELLRTNSEAREYYENKFRYIHVDEFQDTNIVQYKLMKILAQKHGNVFAVGDEDQCIYGWRGANIGNITDFIDDFGCRIFKLEQNYRSSGNILSLANKVIKNNTRRIDKTLFTNNGVGSKVSVFCARNETNEAEYVADVIKKLVEESDCRYSDIAVLMRVNALSRVFEERFLAYNIPHKVYGGFKFFERKEIKDLLAYLRLAVNGNDNEALLRVINFPKRGIGAGAVGQLINYSDLAGRSLFETVMTIESNDDLPLSLQKKVIPFKNVLACIIAQAQSVGIGELAEYLVRILDLKSVFADDTEENENRRMNVSGFVDSVKSHERNNPGTTLEDYLQMITLYTDLDSMNGDDDCVALATVHSVKGLEFKAVFVVGCEEGILPLTRAMDSLDELEEERRLMYVAVTRAMSRLYVTWAASRYMYSERKYTAVSRFLKEANLVEANSQPSAAQSRERAGAYLRNDSYSFGDVPSVSSSRVAAAPVYRAPTVRQPDKKDLSGFKVGTRISHRKFGKGEIVSLDSEAGGLYAQINFEKFGKMMLSLQYAPIEIIEA